MINDILIIGSGGREHALAWKAAASPASGTVYVAPGNAGTATEPGCENVAIGVDDLDALLNFAISKKIGLTIVGPENPLVAGVADKFRKAGQRCFGPSAYSAQLEGSKAFAKSFMQRHGIPTAAFGSFTKIAPAEAFVRKHGAPIVVKADGLAAGKGVIVATTEAEAIIAIYDMLAGNAFGDAGHRVIVEEFLEGEEASFIVIADGQNVVPLATSQDHKAVGDGDTGANTGGMGAYSPAPVVDAALHSRVLEEVINPVIAGMAEEGHPFLGFLYAGLMIAPDGSFSVLEFNVRFGDPETQPILMRLQSDLPALCNAAIDGKLDETEAKWDTRASLGVVMAAAGYPGSYGSGEIINGLDHAFGEDVKVFHAGTKLDGNTVVTAGGRVLCVCALGDTVAAAKDSAYAACSDISWPGAFTRNDIGYRAIAREKAN
jgi:phosphoribosylamine--glycine ligase